MISFNDGEPRRRTNRSFAEIERGVRLAKRLFLFNGSTVTCEPENIQVESTSVNYGHTIIEVPLFGKDTLKIFAGS